MELIFFSGQLTKGAILRNTHTHRKIYTTFSHERFHLFWHKFFIFFYYYYYFTCHWSLFCRPKVIVSHCIVDEFNVFHKFKLTLTHKATELRFTSLLCTLPLWFKCTLSKWNTWILRFTSITVSILYSCLRFNDISKVRRNFEIPQ